MVWRDTKQHVSKQKHGSFNSKAGFNLVPYKAQKRMGFYTDLL